MANAAASLAPPTSLPWAQVSALETKRLRHYDVEGDANERVPHCLHEQIWRRWFWRRWWVEGNSNVGAVRLPARLRTEAIVTFYMRGSQELWGEHVHEARGATKCVLDISDLERVLLTIGTGCVKPVPISLHLIDLMSGPVQHVNGPAAGVLTVRFCPTSLLGSIWAPDGCGVSPDIEANVDDDGLCSSDSEGFSSLFDSEASAADAAMDVFEERDKALCQVRARFAARQEQLFEGRSAARSPVHSKDAWHGYKFVNGVRMRPLHNGKVVYRAERARATSVDDVLFVASKDDRSPTRHITFE